MDCGKERDTGRLSPGGRARSPGPLALQRNGGVSRTESCGSMTGAMGNKAGGWDRNRGTRLQRVTERV